MRYTIQLTKRAERELGRFDPSLQKRIQKQIDALAGDPYPPDSARLAGVRGLYRVRVGDYRIIYRVDSGVLVVLVIRIGHRREVYEHL